MKWFMSSGLSVLVAIAVPGFVNPAVAMPSLNSSRPTLASNDAMAAKPAATEIHATSSITASGTLNDSHFIRITVAGRSLENLSINLPQQNLPYRGIVVMNQAGQTVPAQVSVAQRQVNIQFEQPVPNGQTLEIVFTGIPMLYSGGETLFYSVAATRMGLMGNIPIGTAKVQIPSRS